MSEREIRAEARRHVYSTIGFLWHLAIFVMVNAALVAINMQHTPHYHWFVWPLGGWGFGLSLHGLATFMTGDRTEDMIEREVERRRQLLN
jgi:hypothetical protein